MSTRSVIALNDSDKFTAVYCHDFGFDRENGVGPTLREFYDSKEKAEALISLGDLSRIYPEDVSAYHRDWGRPWDKNKPKVFTSLKALQSYCQQCDAEYLYIFEAGKWKREFTY